MLDQVAMVMFPDLQQLNLLLSAKFVQGLLFMHWGPIIWKSCCNLGCRNLNGDFIHVLKNILYFISHIYGELPLATCTAQKQANPNG